jgi:hypothetical protein
MGETPDKPKSFWATIPGILTGLAALVAAGAGLFTALNQAGKVGPSSAPTAAAPASPPASVQAPSGPRIETHGNKSQVIFGNEGTVNVDNR